MADQAIGVDSDKQKLDGAASENQTLAPPVTGHRALPTLSGPSNDVARTVAVAILTAALVLGGLYLFWQAREIVGWFVGGCVIAAALEPAVNRVQKYHLRRSTAILLVYIVLVLVTLGLMALFVPLFMDQFRGMSAYARDLMSRPEQGQQLLADFAGRYGLTPFLPRLQEWLQSLSGQFTGMAGGFLSYTTGLLSNVAAVVSMLFIAYYLLLDGQKIVAGLLRYVPQTQHARVQRILDESAQAVSGYIMGDILISVICGVAVFVVLVLLEMPYAGPLALLVAILDLVPAIGATLGGLVLVLAGLFVSPVNSLILLVYFIVYQQVENYLLQPLVYSRRVHLQPLTIYIAMGLGGAWMGVTGVLLAIPAAEIVRCIAVEWLASRAEKRDAAAAASHVYVQSSQ